MLAIQCSSHHIHRVLWTRLHDLMLTGLNLLQPTSCTSGPGCSPSTSQVRSIVEAPYHQVELSILDIMQMVLLPSLLAIRDA